MARLSEPGALPTGAEKRRTVTEMFDRVAPSYERLNRIISMGQDRRWRSRMLDRLGLPRGSRVLDVACGTGDLVRALAARGLRPIGVDLSPGMLAQAHADAPMLLGDALALPLPDASLDGVTCGFALRNLVDLDAFFAETARVVRPGGRVAFLDAAEPTGRLVRAGHAVWFRHAVPVIGGLLGDRAAYRYLPASTAYLPDGGALVRAVAAAGFTCVERITMMAGAVQLVTADRATS